MFTIKGESNASFDVVKCKNCTMAYMNPRFETEKIKEFYDKEYFAFQDIKNVRQIIYAQEAVNDIKRFKNKGNLLDIGSAKGLFLMVAKNQGFNVQGLEISEYATNFTKNVFGIEIMKGTAEEESFPEKQFDIITLFDVIEHFREPKRTLIKIKAALKDDGLLVIDTPNIESIYSKFRGKNWGGYGKFHLYYFSKTTLVKLLRDVGLKPIFSKSHKSDLLSMDALWRWGFADYRISSKLEDKFTLSKISPEVNAPIKNLYKNEKYEAVKKILYTQMKNVQNRHSVVMKMQKVLNFPLNCLFNKMFRGDAIRVIAQKK
jgi:2-polyprenyl-3-methyl-5-hydroxy-6-metoxy-1,4-benzoquinol methylase